MRVPRLEKKGSEMKRLASLLFVGLLAYAGGPKHGPKLAKDLEDKVNSNPSAGVRVIVQWKSAPNESKEQKILNRGGTVHSRLQSVKAGVYTLPASAVHDLENDSDVAFITPDRPVTAKLDYTSAAVNAMRLFPSRNPWLLPNDSISAAASSSIES